MATKFKNGIDASSQKVINLATPTADYDAVTKKYVDDRDAAVTANKGYYGEWQSDQNQPYGGTTVVNQSYAMFAEVNDGSNGIRMVSNDGSNSNQSKTRLTFDYAGTYNIQWSGQFENTDNADQDVNVWLRKNGTDIFGSNGIISVPAKHGSVYGHVIPSWNFILTVAAGDYIEFIWSASNAGVYLLYSAGVTRSPSSNSVPSTASVIITAQLVAYVQSAAETTGISSGSVISGTAIGTSNKAVDYSAISNGLQISGSSPNQTVTVKPKTSGGITVDSTGVSLTSNTISGVALGSNLSALSQGTGISTFSYTGAGTATVAIDTNKVPTISTSSYTTTFTPSASTTVTLPTGSTSTLARTDAGQTFTGVQVFTSPTISGTSTSITNVGTFALRDTSAAYDVTIAATSSTALTAARTFTLDLVNGARTLKLGANLTVNNALTFAGTDSTTMTFPSTSATIARTDAAQSFTGVQTFTSPNISGTSTTITNVGTFALRDTSAAFDVTIAATSSTTLTAGRTLTIDLANAARTLKLDANITASTLLTTSSTSSALTSFGTSPTFTGTITIPLTTASTAGVVHASNAGALSTSLIANTDISANVIGVEKLQGTSGTGNVTINSIGAATANYSFGTFTVTSTGAITGGSLATSSNGNITANGSGNISTTSGNINTTSGKYNNVTITAPATGSTLTIADGKTLTANNSIQLSGTDSTTMTFPSTSATIARTDAGQTFTGTQTMTSLSISAQAASLSMNSNKITSVTDPTSAQDAATKNYVDSKNYFYEILTQTPSTPTEKIYTIPRQLARDAVALSNVTGNGGIFAAQIYVPPSLGSLGSKSWNVRFCPTTVSGTYSLRFGLWNSAGTYVASSAEITSGLNTTSTAALPSTTITANLSTGFYYLGVGFAGSGSISLASLDVDDRLLRRFDVNDTTTANLTGVGGNTLGGTYASGSSGFNSGAIFIYTYAAGFIPWIEMY